MVTDWRELREEFIRQFGLSNDLRRNLFLRGFGDGIESGKQIERFGPGNILSTCESNIRGFWEKVKKRADDSDIITKNDFLDSVFLFGYALGALKGFFLIDFDNRNDKSVMELCNTSSGGKHNLIMKNILEMLKSCKEMHLDGMGIDMREFEAFLKENLEERIRSVLASSTIAQKDRETLTALLTLLVQF